MFDADEPAYAQAAREMGERGDWVTPTFNGRPRFDKPALFYWLILLSYKIFGVTEFAVRLWSALAGVGLTLLVALAARRWFGPPADLWAGICFATSLLTALLARAAVTDMLLALFVTGAILAGLEALDRPEGQGRGWAMLLWAGMALAVLVKGPVGLVIPALALGPMLWILREVRSGLRRLVRWEGLALFLVMVAPWYALVLAANGWAFIEGFILKHHLTRYTGVVSSHAGPLWFYLPVLLVGFFPWSAYLPGALWRAWHAGKERKAAQPAIRVVVACACWLVGLLVFFSLAGTKLPSYLFPAFPALALLVGGLGIPHSAFRIPQSAIAPPRWLSRLTPWLIGVVGYALAVGFALLPWILEWARPAARGVLDGVPPPTGPAFLLAALLLAGTTGGLVLAGPKQAAVLATMMAGLVLLAGAVVAPRAHAILQGALQDFARVAHGSLPAEGELVVYGLNAPSIVFYANRTVIPLGAGSIEPLRRLTETGRPVLVITRRALAHQLREVPGLVLLDSRGGYALLGSEALKRLSHR